MYFLPTMRGFFNAVIAQNVNKDLTQFARQELEHMDWRNARAREYHRRKWEYENRWLMVKICKYLATHYEVYAKDVAHQFGISVQKAVALLYKLDYEDNLINVRSHGHSRNTYKLRRGITFAGVD